MKQRTLLVALALLLLLLTFAGLDGGWTWDGVLAAIRSF